MNGSRSGRAAAPDAGSIEYGRAKVSIVRFTGAALAALAVACVAVAASGARHLAALLFLWTAPVMLVFSAFALSHVRLLRGMDGRAVPSFGAANGLTAARIFLAPPIVVLLAGGEVLAGASLYAAAALTDVADGIVARTVGRETLLGVMLDPVGDIVSTSGVFTWLWISGHVPGWLFGLLIVRYVQFFGGLAGLSASGRLPRLGATTAGKVAGVVQGVGIVVLLARAAFPAFALGGVVERGVIPALGAAFAAVIVSQTVIGIRAVRRNHAA